MTRTNHNLWLIAAAAAIAPFMELLDTSIANVALPYIAGNLSASTDESVWVLTSYLVANAVVLPLSGWLSERLGRKRFYLISVFVFTLSSLLCGVAPNLPLLILFRVIQGVGGGGLAPATQAILADIFPKEKIAHAFTIYSFVIVLAPALGPVLGGWISDNWGWRWIFFLNVPCGIAAYFLNRALQPESHVPPKKSRDIDFIGLTTVCLGLGSLEYVLDRGERLDWFSSGTITFFAVVAVVSLAVMVYYELRVAKQPILQLRLFADRNLLMASVFVFGSFFCRYATTALLPEFTHGMLGYTATDSGLVLSPGSACVLFLLPLTAWLMKRVDLRLLIAGGLVVMSTAFYLMSSLSLAVDYKHIVQLRILESVGFSVFLTPISVLAFAQLKGGKNDAAASLFGIFRNLGSAIGISAVNTVLIRNAQVHRAYLTSNLVSSSSVLQGTVTHLAWRMHLEGGMSFVDARQMAVAYVNHKLIEQADVLSYMDCFRLLMYVAIALLPMAFLFVVRKQPATKTEVADALLD
jgi:DHA2 family multidrug resistance protein